ncbi:hypothetical protein B0H34DRAFT_344990 [Crassisporium funariophilum]|nr:hypothetical protein B0H34DRAFT_344990 [Crassisporium funariophilum]
MSYTITNGEFNHEKVPHLTESALSTGFQCQLNDSAHAVACSKELGYGPDMPADVKKVALADLMQMKSATTDGKDVTSPDQRLVARVVRNMNALEATPRVPTPDRQLIKGVMRNISALEAKPPRKTTIKTLPLAHPQSPSDLDKLAESTQSAFKLLVPWCRGKNLPSALAPISRQAILYVQAIDFSIVASQQGFTIAEDALSLSTILKESGPVVDANTEVDLQEYLRGMLDLATKGHNMAIEAMEKFRGVSQTMRELLRIANAEQNADNSSDKKANLKTLSDLKKGIKVLERFATHISLYVTWWNKMEMSHHAQKARAEHLTIDYNSLRNKVVIKKWGELREAYANYTDKIRALQDNYPTMFLESRCAT